MVLVALALAATIGGALLQLVAMERSLLTARQRESQARWLAESGVERAAGRLAADQDYAGETWSLAVEDLGGRGPAEVTIRVETDAASPNRRLVAVEAEFPSDSVTRKRCTKQIELELSSPGVAP